MRVAKKAVIGLFAKAVKYPKTKKIATVIPIKGNIKDLKTSGWTAFVGILKNAFIKAFHESLNQNVDSLRVNNTAELEFKAKLSLVRWKPTAAANIYQVLNDKAVLSFLENCYAQITEPNQQYHRYRLYFLSSYERIDDLEIFGKQFYNFGNEANLSLSSPADVFSTSLGVMYTKSKTLSNYYSVQGAVLRTKAYDFTSQLFNSFQSNVKNKMLKENYVDHQKLDAIVDEYKSLVAYNPNPVEMILQATDPKDAHPSIIPLKLQSETLRLIPTRL